MNLASFVLPSWWRWAAGLAVVVAIAGAGWYVKSVFAERDRLAEANKTLQAKVEAGKRAVKTSEANTMACEKDAQDVADLASKYIKDKTDVDRELADALSRTQRVRVVTRVVDSSPLPSQNGTDAGGDHAAGQCGLSVGDKETMEERLSGLRDEAYVLAGRADKVVKQLTAAQERIRYLEASCRPADPAPG